jgi:MoaA/NifB/PqqE/SkfB family radical SAM enzyme
MIAWDHWHIEPSSICTLKCPRCPRAEIPESLLNRQLTLKFFQTQLGADTIKQIKKITFCGNDGDPIYCRDFLDICEWIKQVNPTIQLVLITNGSHKQINWWQRLANIFDANDEIHWSIDGWDQESNQQYRINSDWESIMSGITTFAQHNTGTYRTWATIAFRFNEDHLIRIKTMALAAGFDSYQLTKSTKFGSKYPTYGVNDPLEPVNAQMISSGHRFERIIQALTTKTKPGNELKKIFLQRAENLKKYSGICLIGNKGVFLNSQGEFYPCCWTANRYEHNQSWHTRAQTQFNLNNRSFQEIIADQFWSTEFLEFNSMECQTKCTPDRLTDQHHTTEW